MTKITVLIMFRSVSTQCWRSMLHTLLVRCSSSLCWSTCTISKVSWRLRAGDEGMVVSELSDAVDATDAPLTSLVLERVIQVSCTRGAVPHEVLGAVCLVLAMYLEATSQTRNRTQTIQVDSVTLFKTKQTKPHKYKQ